MIVLLTGWPSQFYGRKDRAFYLPDWVCSYVEQNQVIEVVDKMMLGERIDQKRFQAFAELALTCMSERVEDQPTIIDAAKQLRQIYESVPPP